MKEVDIGEINGLSDLDKYPPDTLFVLDEGENRFKVPDILKNPNQDKEEH